MDHVGYKLGTALQGPDNSGALGPSCQGGNRNAAVVPLVVQLGAGALPLVVLLGQLAWVQAAPGRMALWVLVGPVA